MHDKELLSPRDVSKELHVTNRTLQRWASVGLLRPSHFTAGGHARYDRASIDAAKRRQRSNLEVEATSVSHKDNGGFQRHADTRSASLASENETRRDPGLVLSSAIERAKRAAERGAKAQRVLSGLQDEAVMALLGIERGELFSRLWRYQLAKVAEALGVSSSRLRDICDLYDIPTPPPGYWLTKPERRGVRILDEYPGLSRGPYCLRALVAK
jgi:DNA-binding transcriptional MerR regulator